MKNPRQRISLLDTIKNIAHAFRDLSSLNNQLQNDRLFSVSEPYPYEKTRAFRKGFDEAMERMGCQS